MRVDVTNCDDCPLCHVDYDEARRCWRLGTVSWYPHDASMPTNCPLLDGDITIGVMGDGDE